MKVGRGRERARDRNRNYAGDIMKMIFEIKKPFKLIELYLLSSNKK